MKAAKHLEAYNIKPSVQRIAIMDYLLKNKTHPTADEIYTALSPSMPTLSKTTVYNTLKLFEEKNAVLVIGIDEKNSRFDGDTSFHAHFICEDCGKIIDVFIDEVPELINLKDIKTTKFLITETQVNFKGLCKNCKRK